MARCAADPGSHSPSPELAGTGENGSIVDPSEVEIAPAAGVVGRSVGNPGNPRAAALASLFSHAAALAAAGDLAGARALHATISKLLGDDDGGSRAAVVDLASRRGDR